MTTDCKRGIRKSLQGSVKSNLSNKTITVEVVRIIKHEKYGKYIKKNSLYSAHDEFNKCNIGDNVLIVESKPYSKSKKWCLKKIIKNTKH